MGMQARHDLSLAFGRRQCPSTWGRILCELLDSVPLSFLLWSLDTGPGLAISVLDVPVTLEANLGGAMPRNEAEHKF